MIPLPAAGRLSAEVDFAMEALHAAAMVLHAVGPSPSTLNKSDRTPVTAADFAVQAALAGLLQRSFPDDVLVAEESSAPLREAQAARVREEAVEAARLVHPGADADQVLGWLDRGQGEPAVRFWALDPVDGTKGLLRGGQFVTALALIQDGQIVLGALACPRYYPFGEGGSFALAVRGEGAWVAPAPDGPWTRLAVSTEADPARCRLLRSVVSGRSTDDRLADLRRTLGTTAPEVRMDSQVKYLALSASAGDLIVRLPRQQGALRENIWDHACGVLLVDEAGGRATDVLGRQLDFTAARQMVRNSGVVASNGRLHRAALEALSRTAPRPAEESRA